MQDPTKPEEITNDLGGDTGGDTGMIELPED